MVASHPTAAFLQTIHPAEVEKNTANGTKRIQTSKGIA
jgi:hypothetical protein